MDCISTTIGQASVSEMEAAIFRRKMTCHKDFILRIQQTLVQYCKIYVINLTLHGNHITDIDRPFVFALWNFFCHLP